MIKIELLLVDLSILQHFVNRTENYKTGVEREHELDLLQEAITAIDIILKELPKSQAVSMGRSFFYKPQRFEEFNDIGRGRWIWDGFSQSVRPGQWKPYINIDKTCGVFVKPLPLLEFILNMLDTKDINLAFDPNNRKYSHKISDHLNSLHVISSHLQYPKRSRIVSRGSVLLKSARDEIFEKDGNKISVEQYFLQQYKIRLKHPHIPCINVGKPPTANSAGKRVALPIELCLIKDAQRSGQELESEQTTKMLKFAARPAPERRDMINEIARNVLGRTDEVQAHYGVSTKPEMLRVDGRVLQPPQILYDQEARAEPSRGQWDITRYKLLQAKPMDSWIVIDFCRTDDRNISNFVRELIHQGGSKGMVIKPPREIIQRQPKTDTEIRKLLIELKQYFGVLQMIVVILDEKMQPRKFSSVVYREVKKVGDTEIGVPTQCVKQFNVNKANGSTVGNICLKINAKLGGVNHSIIMEGTPTAQLMKDPTMFMGADVNHPKPGTDRYTPSIAAAVATIDRRLAKYASSCRFQQHERADADTTTGTKRHYRKEIIIEFKAMAKELINAFILYNKGRRPQKIIYYRDGVSEGQFQHVLEHELLALRAACLEIDPEYKPTMTIIIVQKRHHLRMFPSNPRDACGKAQNIPPGTTLDHTVTHQVEFNFYLNSHFALQGTAKCALYHVLWDENGFNSDSLQAITFQLCHTYARCAKSVSYPTPVYYSHWVAFRYNKSAGYGDPDRDRNQLIPPNGNWDQFRKEVKTDLGTMYWA
ncbi:putative translation initiation factor 2c [Oopsacas minuta]|uniref:Translation initiation factor 2c n=1 Tax=Oopsacas minuta TaxID=111878 RepID=A0AAV7JPU3_9METZ|nr:putative translation initiation factor 2c [Oopsacas minuta]